MTILVYLERIVYLGKQRFYPFAFTFTNNNKQTRTKTNKRYLLPYSFQFSKRISDS